MKTKIFYSLLLAGFLALGTSCEKKTMNVDSQKKPHCTKHANHSDDAVTEEVQS